MPRYRAETLRSFADEIFRREGVPEENLEMVSGHLVRADLAGMHSHGLLRIPQYVELMRSGTIDGIAFYNIDPNGPFRIVRDNGSVVTVDGSYNFGQVTACKAVDLAAARAEEHGVASVACRRTAHIGRVGEFVQMAAERDMVAMIFANVGRIAAPHGGAERKIGSNPFSVGIPTGGEFPFVLDYATCSTAEGKIRDRQLAGETVPRGWIIDADGRDTETPRDLYEGGAILPFGGDQGHKGYALALMVEMLGAMLTGTGFPGYGGYRFATSGVVITVYDISRFTDVETFKAGVDQIIRGVKSSRLRRGFEEILIPGEPEFLSTRRSSAEGVDLSDGVVRKLEEVAGSLGIRADEYLNEDSSG